MAIFEEVVLKWREGDEEREYRLPADRILKAIAQVEDVITFHELVRRETAQKPPMAKLAIAYGILLRCAGANVTDEQVYNGMFVAQEMRFRVIEALTTLQTLMIPPGHLRTKVDAVGKSEATSQSSSSPPSTKPS